MYIDAVRAILTKISDPNIKPSIKKDLGLQLRQLDPTGKIREFIETGEKGELDVGLDVKSKREKSTNNPKRSGPNGASENKKKKESDSSQGDRQSKTSSSSNNGGNGNDGNRGSKADSSGGDKAVNLVRRCLPA
ncbi:hypothetical protein EON64_00495 [archaeon]|nr:MAG: hypothetical protein EON64_00495 [archaeon]